MTIHTENIGKLTEADPVSWDSTDALLYALSVGAGAGDPAGHLAFTTENSRGVRQQVLPTFPVVLGGGGGSLAELGDFRLSQILHGGQSVTVHRSLGTEGTVIPVSGMSAAYDKGKNAVVEVTTRLLDARDRAPVATNVTTMIIRGEGGFGGEPGPAGRVGLPDRPADATVRQRTAADQALIYRLNGDRNPLHSDPSLAAKAGFDRPILHGLCTMGFAGRAVLEQVCDSDPENFGRVSVRFVSPVVPGDELTTSIWLTDTGAVFQVRVGDAVVLDRGTYTHRSALEPPARAETAGETTAAPLAPGRKEPR